MEPNGLLGGCAPLGQSLRCIGAVQHITRQLPASGINVVAARFPHRRHQTAFVQNLPKPQHHGTG
jgi:hypothetical protein